MTIREAVSFNFDGIASEDMGVHIVSTDSGLYEEHFLANRTIIETVTSNRKPYFQRVDSEPLSFSLSIFIHDWRDRDNLRQIQKWLNQDYYKPLTFDSQPERIYYAVLEGSSAIRHNGAKEGYITLSVRCDSNYSYSYLEQYELQGDSSSVIYNDGDMSVKPKARITYHGTDGNLTITNSENNQTITFNNLQNEEEIFIDFKEETIVSSLQYLNVYRYENHNDEWLEFIEGENEIAVVGDCTIQLEYQKIYLS